jgi:hypothetical protein
MPRIVANAGTWWARLLAVAGLGLTLGACTKCDVPTWQRSSSGDAPVACHDSPAPQ